MRFAVIGPTYPYRGGIAHHTTLLVRALRDAGHETLFISFVRQYPAFLFPGKNDRDPSAQPLMEDAEYLLDSMNPLTWRRVVRRVAAWQPDAVVLPWWVPFWAPHWAVIGRAVKGLAFRPKLLFICHNVLPHEPGRLDRAAARVALGPGDGFVLHSQADAQRLERLLPGKPARVTPHPTYAPLAPAGAVGIDLPADQYNLLLCGLVRRYKGLDLLLDALPDVVAALPQTHLTVVGEFWDGVKAYAAQIERLGLTHHVTLRDEYVPNETLAGYLRSADVVVLPYRSATQSGIIQAAFGQGTPVITTDVGGLAEAVEHERTGLVVAANDSEALSNAIITFAAPQLRDTFAANIEALDAFSWSTLIDILEALVDQPR